MRCPRLALVCFLLAGSLAAPTDVAAAGRALAEPGSAAAPVAHHALAPASSLLLASGQQGSGELFPPAPDELLPPITSVLLRAFEQPPTPFSAGHRGVDLEVEPGDTVLLAPIDGRLSTGVTVGNRYVTIEPSNGSMRVTLSYLSEVIVTSGTDVEAGEPVAVAGTGHGDGEVPDPHTHLSVRLPDLTDPSGWTYVDPMPYMRRYLRRVRGPVTRLDL